MEQTWGGRGREASKWAPRFGTEHLEVRAPGSLWKHLEARATEGNDAAGGVLRGKLAPVCCKEAHTTFKERAVERKSRIRLISLDNPTVAMLLAYPDPPAPSVLVCSNYIHIQDGKI